MTATDPQRIVVATDGSPTARQAVEQAVALARRFDVPLVGLHAIDPWTWSTVPGELAAGALADVLRREGEAAVGHVAETARAAGVPEETHLLEGHPHDVIVEHVRPTDLLVVGSTGHRGVTRLLLGSVAARVVRLAPCPVLVVPARADETNA